MPPSSEPLPPDPGGGRKPPGPPGPPTGGLKPGLPGPPEFSADASVGPAAPAIKFEDL